MINKIQTEKAPAAIGPYSQAISVGELVFTSGQIALDPENGVMVGTDVREQTHRVCKNLSAVLAAAGSSFDKVVKTTCFFERYGGFCRIQRGLCRVFHKQARSLLCCRKGASKGGAR